MLLDLDGTLLDSRRVADALQATCRWIAEQRPGVDAEMLMLANRRAWREFWPAVEDAWTRGTMEAFQDAEDALQDTLLAAWQSFGEFEGRAPHLALPDRHHPVPQRASVGQPTPGKGVGCAQG